LERGLGSQIIASVLALRGSFRVKSTVLNVGPSLPVYPGGLNRSTQRFILEGKDGV
jgi:hypothetical protein